MGWQPRAVIHGILRRAGLVLVPMSGFVLLEAASIGKPVITSRVEWHSELVEDTKTGLLVDPTSPQEWRDAIDRMLGDPDLAERMAAALRAEFLRGCTPDRAKRLELDLYNSLVET
jgi:glycosyltransferase involved in cell wall biosynthesis